MGAWQVTARRGTLRRIPQLRELQLLLVSLTNEGTTHRQEAVSMVPPFLLRVERHHVVLDICASPGNKTAQLVEALHGGAGGAGGVSGGPPTGMVVANDSDRARAYLLVHQVCVCVPRCV